MAGKSHDDGRRFASADLRVTVRMNIVVEAIEHSDHGLGVEIVERKGLGHPDTLCDALAEQFSLALSRFYLERFGTILHHNVDKALLRGGTARARFGGGEVVEPIELYLAGRAVTSAAGVTVPVEELAVESARKWLREHLHALDAERHLRIHCMVRPASVDLAELFAREREGAPLSNDTSIGVGYAPLTPLERVTLELEQGLNAPELIAQRPAQGEDVKIMAVRRGADLELTVARAMVAGHVPSRWAYQEETGIARLHAARAAEPLGHTTRIRVNAADAPDGSSVYLTVTGTSAECGDDGEVGRGNRGNGLITPRRPMTMEALAGKNPVTHVGKIYNVVAREIAEDIVAKVPGVAYAECYLVSRIGAPIDEPALAHARVSTDSAGARADARLVEDVVRTHLASIGSISQRLLAGSIRLY